MNQEWVKVGKFEKGRGGMMVDDSEPRPTPGGLTSNRGHQLYIAI